MTYTSFHNEAQTTADMDQLLEQMLLGLQCRSGVRALEYLHPAGGR